MNIQLKQFGSDSLSMGNASMKNPAMLIVNADGTSRIEIDMQSLKYLGRDGYLGWLKKVTKVISENKYHYPTEIETEDAEVLEEFVDVYDMFNDPSSENADSSVVGKWYPKVLSMPVNTSEEEILVQVYVPVMESIMEGGGTKFARLVLDYSSLEKIEEPIEESSEPSEKSEVSEISEVSKQSEVSEISEISVPTVPATLDRYNLADGEYVVDGHMIKIDRESSSMSEKSIDHKIKLIVKDRKINVTMNFKGITIGDKYGYLGKLSYFLTGYTENQYGRPQGEIAPAAINSYHLDEKKPAENSKLPIFNGGLNNKPLVPETDNNTSSVTAAVNNTVATGDSTSLAGILAAITVSLGAVFALSKKRKNDN